MKKNIISLAAAILTICGATMTTSCSNADNPASSDKYVTATFTASFENVAQTRAVNIIGGWAFAIKDKVAVLYENTNGEMVKAVSNEVATPGPTATFTVTMVNPKANGALQCLYPASMASDEPGTNYNVLFTEQDGDLGTFNQRFHLALYKGSLTAEAKVPSSIELVNRLAICCITVKDGDNDITSDVTKLIVKYGDNNYILSPASLNYIWLGLVPVEESDVIVYAVKGDELFKGTIPGPLKAGWLDDITVNVTKVTDESGIFLKPKITWITPASETSSDVHIIKLTDGLLYAIDIPNANITFSGTSYGYQYSFSVSDPYGESNIVLDNLSAIYDGSGDGAFFINSFNDTRIEVKGTNTIISNHYAYPIDIMGELKLHGNGTLTITTPNLKSCGINAVNYILRTFSADPLDVTSLIAEDGYTVYRSGRTVNADHTCSWTYTVRPKQ